MTYFRCALIRAAKFTSLIAVLFGIQSSLLPQPVAAESIEELRGMKPMSASELAASTGGFILPNGLNINVGVMVDSIVHNAMGNLSVTSTFSTEDTHVHTQVTNNGTTTDSIGSVSADLQGNGGVTHIMHMHDGLSAIITNTANNVDINQSKTVNISVSNYYATMNPGLAGRLIALRVEAMNGIPLKFH